MNKTLLTGVGGAVASLVTVVVVLPMAMMMMFFASDEEDPVLSGTGAGLSSAVPAQYAPWVLKAGSICPEVTPALIAAQIEAESDWNPNSTSPVGAVGIAQFMPSNFHLVQDENGDGKADPMDPADEIPAQGRLMCSLIPLFKPAATGDELLRLALAAYNAGPGNVLPRGCSVANTTTCKPSVPPFAETQGYVTRIMAAIPKYQGATVANGAWIHPLANYTVGGTFRQIGSHWQMCGFHTGYDYSAPMGTPVRAAYAGTVIHAAWGSEAGGTGSAYGNQIIIQHAGGMRSYYDHLSAYAVHQGDQVTTGQVIGQVGQTGNAFGAHLHMELTKSAAFTCDNFLDPHAFINAHLTAQPAAGGGQAASSATVNAVLTAARSQLGVRYSYGGGALDGPSANPAGVVGFDCSSFVRYAWYQGTNKRLVIPRTSQEQAARLTPVDSPQPGDLIVWKLNSSEFDHVGLYLGNGQMIHAPNPRKTIEIVSLSSGYYSSHTHEYRRPS